MKVAISPTFDGQDNADGGIRQVVKAMHRWLPELGVEIVANPQEADIFAVHAITPDVPCSKDWRNIIVSHNHGLYWSEYEWGSWAADANIQVVESLDRSNCMTAPSEWVANILRRGFLRDVPVLYHGVDLEDWPVGRDQGYVLWNKTRVDAVCDAEPLSRLASMAPDVPFVSTFGASTLPNLSIVNPSAWAEHKPLVQNAGVYLATTRETMGIGTLEAMACGVPILGWDWGGQHEIVKHGETGWLCRPGDYDSLLAGLEWCLTNRARLSKAARDSIVGSYTWHIAMERYANLYAQLLDGRQDDTASQPRASIIITCYKLERFLEEAVKSAVALRNVEVIVVDDCSPGDNSGIVAKDVAARYGVRYLRTPENLYLAGALNWAIAQAKAPIIIPLDADNVFGPAADELIKALENDRGIDIAYGKMKVLVYDEAEVLGREYISDWPVEFRFPRQITGHNQIPSTAAYRKDVWARVGGYRERCKTADDADFWCRATSYGGRAALVTNGVTFVYRDRLDSMSHTVPLWPFWEWYSWSHKSALTPLGSALTRDERKNNLKFPTHEPCLVSIIVPVGPGHDKYLPDAIDSVLSQTETRWELIIVNDSGKDLRWVPSCAKVLATAKPHSGPSVARNMGLAVAKGVSFLFLDADDYLQPNAIEWLWEVFKAKDGQHFVYGDFIDQPSGATEALPDYTNDMFLRKSPIPVTFMGPMWAVTKKGLRFDEAMNAWEDWDLFLQMCELGLCGTHLTVPVFNYRTTTGMRRESMYEHRDVLKEEILAKWGQYIKGDKAMPCAGCGQSTWKVSPPAMNMEAIKAAQAGQTSDFVAVEYVGEKEGTHSYTGKATGQSYNFGKTRGHNVLYVQKDDAKAFIDAWPSWFQLYDQDRSVLAATPMMAPSR